MSGKMIDLIIQEPCRSCQGMWLAVKQPLTYIDSDGHMKQQPVEIYCVHEKVCKKLNEIRDDADLLTDKIATFLDENPDKDISVQLHCEGGDWKHIVRIEKRKYAKF